jgi:ABC-2 type transport system ATP-binding protein
MSIKVKNINKWYGDNQALNDVSFSIEKGSIVGFLGPNGAGKSTLMKILTTYISPSSGTGYVNGYSVSEQSIDVRKCIGYLPEHNPLYLDMYVAEYLEFVSNVHRVSKDRISTVIRQTGLTDESNKKIEQLSKGYRQRVGLASALLHDPEVLILDEPTTGLDPNQIIEIRELIKAVVKESNKTVLLSTHIMQEVEALCDHVIIIDKGNIVHDRSLRETLKVKDLESLFSELTTQR